MTDRRVEGVEQERVGWPSTTSRLRAPVGAERVGDISFPIGRAANSSSRSRRSDRSPKGTRICRRGKRMLKPAPPCGRGSRPALDDREGSRGNAKYDGDGPLVAEIGGKRDDLYGDDAEICRQLDAVEIELAEGAVVDGIG